VTATRIPIESAEYKSLVRLANVRPSMIANEKCEVRESMLSLLEDQLTALDMKSLCIAQTRQNLIDLREMILPQALVQSETRSP
jgi:hypothetical protein